MKYKRLYCICFAALLALSMTGCNKNNDDSGVLGDSPPVESDVAVMEDTSNGELLQLAINKLNVADGFHADIETDITLNLKVGDETRSIPVTATVSSDMTKGLRYTVYSGTDISSEDMSDITYESYTDLSTGQVYTNRYSEESGSESGWAYTNADSVFVLGDAKIPDENYSKVTADGNVFKIALSDMKASSASVSAETSSADTESGSSGISREQVGSADDDEVSVSNSSTTEFLTEDISNDLFAYIEQNYDKFSGDVLFTLDDDGNLKSASVSGAKSTMVSSVTDDVTYELSIEMNTSVNISKIGEVTDETLFIPDDVTSTAMAYSPVDYSTDESSSTAILSTVSDDSITAFKLDGTSFSVPMDITDTIDGWKGQAVTDTLWGYTNDNYADCDIFAVVDDSSIIGLTVSVYPSYINANADRTVFNPGDERQGEYPALDVAVKGVNVSWGMSTEEILAIYGTPSAVVENDGFTDYTYTKIIDNVVRSCTFSVYNEGGFMAYSVNIAYL